MTRLHSGVRGDVSITSLRCDTWGPFCSAASKDWTQTQRVARSDPQHHNTTVPLSWHPSSNCEEMKGGGHATCSGGSWSGKCSAETSVSSALFVIISAFCFLVLFYSFFILVMLHNGKIVLNRHLQIAMQKAKIICYLSFVLNNFYWNEQKRLALTVKWTMHWSFAGFAMLWY